MNFLFLHGLAGDPTNWDHVARRLTAMGHSCFIPTIPYLTGDHRSIEDLASDVLANYHGTFDEHSHHASIVVGNSIGGAIALEIGDNFQKIVLVSSYTETSASFISRGATAVARELDRIFYDPSIISDTERQKYNKLWSDFTSSRKSFSRLRRLKSIAAAYNFEDRYNTLQKKIVLICGDRDKISPLYQFESLTKQYPDMKLGIIERCGHAPPVERPDELFRHIVSTVIA